MKQIVIPALVLILSLLAIYRKPIAQKVAILGGGAASCAVALSLTDQLGWKEHYDITIYQLGWRLGGKAASGRNKKYGQRVEEITGHWYPGIYHNTKRLLSLVYEELNRPEGVPLRTFDDAFEWTSYITNKRLNVSMHSLDGERRCASFKYLFETLVKGTFFLMDMVAKQTNNSFIQTDEVDLDHLLVNRNLLQRKLNSIQQRIQDLSKKYTTTMELLSVVDIGITVSKGILDDNLSEEGFDSINHLDLRKWLSKHGASVKALQSAFVKFHYDVILSYRNGNIEEPDLEAGTALKIGLPAWLCYDDIAFFKQQGPDGDVIFAPMYELLRKRGVSFKFFHKVEELKLDINNPKLVEQLRMTKQVELINEEYDPLIDVKGLPSWPNEPRYEEIDHEQAKLLKKYDIDLESFWTRWPSIYEEHYKQPLPEVILKRGQDFDIIVFGIPIGSLPYLGSELLETSQSLRDATKHIGRTSSVQVQLWTDIARENLMSDSYIEFLDSNRETVDYTIGYAEVNLKLEDWKSLQMKPKSCTYFVFLKDIKELPPSNYTLFPHDCKETVKKFVKSRIENSFKVSLPNAYTNGNFNWEILTDPENRIGEERLDAQYFRVNVNPSDRFVQILSNTSQYRIRTDGAGFDNIYFTGDWIQNGFNCCVEGALTAGMLTSKAISGYPKEISWEQYIPNKQCKKRKWF